MAFSFLKTGKASADLASKHQKEQELRKQEQGKMFRFWMKENEEARITFIDGELGPEGYLTPPRYYEHNLYQAGKWNNFYVCPKLTTPDSKDECPICESGDRPALVALFTVIDHRQVMSKDKTKVYKDTKRLLVAKPQTFELLNKHAIKRGGLAGATFDASRIGDKSASVGSMFDFVEKKPVEELKAIYMTEKIDPKTNVKSKVTNFTPANYEHEITYRTGEELAIAVGAATKPGGDGEGNGGAPADYADQL
jgi:hypothetical protein